MFPFPWFWLQCRFPFSGDVMQDIDPTTIWDLPFSGPYKGDKELERKILADGAGYGEQLKVILNVLEKLLANSTIRSSTEGKELLELKEKIAAIKQGYYKDSAQQARTALDKLKEKDKDAYTALVKELT